MTFTVQWPDGRRRRYYSPSLVITEHLTVGARYDVGDFLDRSAAALTEASDRVQAKYGFPCSSAAASLRDIRTAAAGTSGSVEVLAFEGAMSESAGGGR
ncbi:MSMEG_0570 family nitrogen starvation response protein [Rhodococcoides corynebacterioides]|uniref:MSMEG_0570 family nitrogen starvation response protein n=1 Tax=Rhodococcoides corynebacterioides TaxID=53972 RepID=UPI003F7DB268